MTWLRFEFWAEVALAILCAWMLFFVHIPRESGIGIAVSLVLGGYSIYRAVAVRRQMSRGAE